MSANLFTAFEPSFTAGGARPCLTPGGGRTIGYGELAGRSAQYAHALREAGVAPGDRVAVQVPKSAENVALYLACLQAGAVYLPLNTAYTDGELAYFFGDAEPALVVCASERRDGVAALEATRNRPIHTLDAAGKAASPRRRTPKAAGSTRWRARTTISLRSSTRRAPPGAPRGDDHPWQSALQRRDADRRLEHQRDDVLLHALPIYPVHGLFVALNTMLIAGAHLLFEPKFDVARVIELLPGATVMMGVPTFYTRLLGHRDFDRARCAGMRLFVAGSAPLLAETFKAFEARTGHAILERYGMTETGMLCSNPLQGERRPGTVGAPLAGVELRVADEDGKVLPRGETGVIEVRGPNVFRGYWRMPEKTEEEFHEGGFFITGDVGFVDDDGYLHIIGRAKDMIISGGFNVYPKEIEEVIDRMDGVEESAVIGLPHPDFGEGVAAVVVAETQAAVSEEAVIETVRAELASFKAPKAVFLVDTLPRNSMGKVQKNALRQRFVDRFLR
ncbi:MAG: AMP-binding protein [Hyphomicrobiales bacterium]